MTHRASSSMDLCIISLRRLLSAIALTAGAIFIAALPAFAEDIGANKSELIRGLLPTVVNISVRKQEAATAVTPAPSVAAAMPGTDTSPAIKSYVGSGFVIDPSGLVVSNYHVVEDAFEITVMFSDGSRLPGRTLSASRLADLAVIKVETNHPLPAAHWGNSDLLRVGDQVFAAGNPFGIGLSVSAGIVSGLNRDIQNSPYDDLIQTDAPINHGNSGGPLFDMQGNVVGVNSAIISPTTGSVGLGFAIPSSSARFVVNQLLTYGWVRPGWIGVKLQTVTREMADAMGAAQPEGSIISWVLADGPAKKAGLAVGDVILRYDGSTPSDERALLRDIAHTMAGDTMKLVVRHEGVEHDVVVTAQEWPRNQWDARDAPTAVQRPKVTIPPDLGLSLTELSAEERMKLPSETGEAGTTGVLVTGVAANSDPARRGMVSGDVILRVQDKSVATAAEVLSSVTAARAGKRDYIMMLILPKASAVPGPKWVALQLETSGG